MFFMLYVSPFLQKNEHCKIILMVNYITYNRSPFHGLVKPPGKVFVYLVIFAEE